MSDLFRKQVIEAQSNVWLGSICLTQPRRTKMPMRYQTIIGGMGSTLSGGQKQRIVLARALFRQPRILFLDEATSHFDVGRERLVNEAVRSLAITKVIVAHRPETVASADRTLILERGFVVCGNGPEGSLAYRASQRF